MNARVRVRACVGLLCITVSSCNDEMSLAVYGLTVAVILFTVERLNCPDTVALDCASIEEPHLSKRLVEIPDEVIAAVTLGNMDLCDLADPSEFVR